MYYALVIELWGGVEEPCRLDRESRTHPENVFWEEVGYPEVTQVYSPWGKVAHSGGKGKGPPYVYGKKTPGAPCIAISRSASRLWVSSGAPSRKVSTDWAIGPDRRPLRGHPQPRRRLARRPRREAHEDGRRRGPDEELLRFLHLHGARPLRHPLPGCADLDLGGPVDGCALRQDHHRGCRTQEGPQSHCTRRRALRRS